ncbi:MAG TPA: B-box zinc finger protein [Bryobacteraceae bacterium]|nr:B-box zinc finger protein [Bryobacteraceae bacterium]
MNCANHPEIEATAYCRTCGKPLCASCQRNAGGAIFCEEHVPAAASQPLPADSPYTAPYPPPPLPSNAPDASASPALAFILGLIPGVGAIYNGQYVKGLLHVVILGFLISIVSSDTDGTFAPMFGMLIGVWVFYMAFEAYHTARKRQLGERVDEFSSLVPLRRSRRVFPAGPIVLIAIGILFLLNNLDIIRYSQIIRYWPLALIALGAYMLYERVAFTASNASPNQEFRHGSR